MKVIRASDTETVLADRPIFVGRVHTRRLVGNETAQGLRLSVVTFDPDARTADHSHSHEQVLYVLDGEGILATENERHVVHAGDIVYVPPGEVHWHGATETSHFSHISITTPGETTLLTS